MFDSLASQNPESLIHKSLQSQIKQSGYQTKPVTVTDGTYTLPLV